MHLLVYSGQVSWRLYDKIFSRVGVLYNLKLQQIIFGQHTAEFYDKHILFNHALYFFFVKIWLKMTLFKITSNKNEYV